MIESFMIPKSAAESIVSRTPQQVYDEMIESGMISDHNIMVFGVMYTPICLGEIPSTENIVGCVTLWWNKNVVVTDKDGKVLGVEVGRGAVTSDDAVQLYEKYQKEF